MNLKLKSAVESAYALCDKLQQTDSWDKANTATAREIFRGELFHFLLYLSFADGVISSGESTFIKYYLGFDYSVKEMREYAVANSIYGSAFTSKVPYCFKAFVKYDNSGDNAGECAKLILDIYARLGQEFLACDKSTSSENYSLKAYCENMRSFMDNALIDSVQLSLGSLNEKNKAVAQPIAVSTPSPTALTSQEIQSEAKTEQEPKEAGKTLDQLMEELNDLVGLKQVKTDVKDLINLVKIRGIRKERGLASPAMSLHLVFSGNPGTGKTTIARLLAQIYKAMGLLSKGQLTEVDRAGLVGGYVGQTALKVQEVVNKAKGGVLFIDEAYSLTVNKGSNDYGFEAVDTLLKYMEDNRDDLIVIVAGYPEPMDQFLESNPGLKSRFNKYLFFEDYTPQELIEILKSMAEKSGLTLSKEAENFAENFFKNRCENKPDNFANARDVRNFFEKALVYQANRLAALESISDEALASIELSDMENILF